MIPSDPAWKRYFKTTTFKNNDSAVILVDFDEPIVLSLKNDVGGNFDKILWKAIFRQTALDGSVKIKLSSFDM